MVNTIGHPKHQKHEDQPVDELAGHPEVLAGQVVVHQGRTSHHTLSQVSGVMRKYSEYYKIYHRDVEELMTILAQARDNRSSLKIVGGDYHVTQTKEDIIVSLRYMDRLLGLDTSAKTVTVEPGMKVSTLSSILATINLSVDLAGRVPDLTITDCLAVGGPGLGCGGAGLGASVISVQVYTRLSLAAAVMICPLIG